MKPFNSARLNHPFLSKIHLTTKFHINYIPKMNQHVEMKRYHITEKNHTKTTHNPVSDNNENLKKQKNIIKIQNSTLITGTLQTQRPQPVKK